MNLKSDGINFMESSSSRTNPSAVSSQPWWFGMGHGGLTMDVLGENRKSSSPTEHLDGWLGTKSSGSQSNHGSNERINGHNEMQSTELVLTDGKYEEKQAFSLLAASTVPTTTMGEYVAQPTQLELAGHTIASPTYPYSDPYFGGAVPTYGPQATVHPQSLGLHGSRMVLPLEMAEEPVYVNAKQYHGILRRRQLRAKLELEKKLIKVRKPYLHESRHLHAMRRARGCGGRFLNTKKLDNNASNATPDKGSNGPSVNNAQATHPQQVFPNSNGQGSYIFQGFQLSTSRSHSDRMERDFSGQHDRMVVTGVPHRTLTIK